MIEHDLLYDRISQEGKNYTRKIWETVDKAGKKTADCGKERRICGENKKFHLQSGAQAEFCIKFLMTSEPVKEAPFFKLIF